MKITLILFQLLFSLVLQAQVTKVEHFYASSPQAVKLFHVFQHDFQLPIVWNFQTYGDFASGGVTLGNVVFEFVTYKGIAETKFEGIALESKQHIEDFVSMLDAAGIEHDTIQPNTFVNKNGVLVGWSNMVIKNVLPEEAGLFICDYKERERIFSGRKSASDTLRINDGGPLGLIELKEIGVHTTNYQQHKKNLLQLPGVKNDGSLFSFSYGPSIRLVDADNNGTQKIIIKVRSLAAAKSFLQSKQMLGNVGINSIYILPEAIEGLQVELVE